MTGIADDVDWFDDKKVNEDALHDACVDEESLQQVAELIKHVDERIVKVASQMLFEVLSRDTMLAALLGTHDREQRHIMIQTLLKNASESTLNWAAGNRQNELQEELMKLGEAL